jgi:hypothetical protein
LQEKWNPLFRPELRHNKEQLQEKWNPLFRPQSRRKSVVIRPILLETGIGDYHVKSCHLEKG